MKINEIFYSIEGEGKRVGQPCVFIRRSGCNLHCKYDGKDCDTPYRDEGEYMTVSEILSEVGKYGCKNVTLTGGEPLLPRYDLMDLRLALSDRGYQVNIETNGTMSTEARAKNEFFTVDYKCGCSGETDKMNPEAFVHLTEKDVIKLVIAEEDIEQAKKVVDMFSRRFRENAPFIYISPCYGRIRLDVLAGLVKDLYKTYPRIGVSLQIHKIIWSPEERGV